MKKIYLLSLIFLSSTLLGQTPIITMISDGDCSGGNPKVLEIYANGTVDFSNYSLEKSANGGAWGSTFSLASLGTITDDFVYVYKDDPSFATEYPSATNVLATTSQSVNFNGDDAVRIVDGSSNVIDQYGQDATDGTGTFWEYQDGYAKRNSSTGPNGGTFVQANWTFNNGALSNEGSCNGGTIFETIIGIGTFTITPSPAITANPTTLSGFTYVEGSGPSAEQSFDVSGANLTADITLSAPSNYEISETSGSGFTNAITLSQSSGTVASTTIYVRLISGLTASGSPYNQSISATSSGASNVDINLEGTVTLPTPMISVSPASLTGFTYAEGSGPSTEQSFTVSGTNLTSDITVTAPANYEISETSGSGFTNTIILTQSSGTVASTTIYVRLSAGLTAAGSPYNQTITASSTGATTQDVDVEGTVTAAPTPVITASPTSLTGFTYVEGSGPSAEQSFDVEGSGLSADIALSAPTNYEISETSGSGFTNTITLTQSSGTVASTTIYVRLKSSLTAASSPFNEMVTITSSGALDVEVDLEGTVTVTTNVTVSETSLTGFSYMQSNGGPSNFQSFNVGGAGLSGDITITAPANYEISATSGSGYTNSIDLSPVNGTVSATTIYVRLKGGLMASGSPYNEDVTISSAGVSDQTVTLEGEVIDDVGIGEASENEFSVYPNPFNQQFTIISNQNDVTVVITDVLGKVVYTNTNIKDKTVVQIEVPSGIYFVTLTSGDNAITKKLIKK